jgi:hypothetical protein
MNRRRPPPPTAGTRGTRLAPPHGPCMRTLDKVRLMDVCRGRALGGGRRRDYGACAAFASRVEHPLQPFNDDDDCRLIEHGCIKERKPQWSVKHPPQQTARAVRVHMMLTLLMFAWATAYHLQWAQADTGHEPVGWPRWRRQLLQQTRDPVIVCAQDYYGIFHMAAYPLLLGVKRKDVPPGIGTHPEILTKFGLTAHG